VSLLVLGFSPVWKSVNVISANSRGYMSPALKCIRIGCKKYYSPLKEGSASLKRR
jgi:hypothetical protein